MISVNKPKPGKMQRLVLGAVVCLVIAGALVPPAYAGKKKQAEQVQQEPQKPAIDTSKLVWPAPPDVARIKWLMQLTGEADLKPAVKQEIKKKMSWMDKMAGVEMPKQAQKKSISLAKPFGVVSDSKGRVYAADSGQGAVFIFDLEHRNVTFVNAKFALPMGLAIDDTDRLFVVDSRLHQVSIIGADGKLENVTGQDKLERPVGAAVDDENRLLYVVDAKASRLAVFDADSGKFLRYLGKPSDPLDPQDGTFATPLGVAVDSDGNVFVTDTLNDRVQEFDADGEFINAFGKQGDSPGSFMRAKGIAVDADGHIYVTDAEFNNVQVFDKDGHFVAVFGTIGEDPGQFTLITGIYVDKKNRILVADQWHGRVQVLQYVTDTEATAQKAKREEPSSDKQVAGNPDPNAVARTESAPK